MLTLKINSVKFEIKQGISILEACRLVGVKIPRFCYHETLSIAGNCRMCVVTLESSDDALIVSCLTEIAENMEIITENSLVKKAREDILEFLLLNHPLDCPICDQGGECDLQDQSKNFGNNVSKYFLNKLVVEDKNFSPFIKTVMTRCIRCTRCVRFSSEIAGNSFFGTLNRGNSTEISVYTEQNFNSEISSNVIDLCPVGALTSKPYSFKSRPWELKTLETIDLTDALGSNIYANYLNNKILRVLPKLNKEINEHIISDKARFSYDSITSPLVLKNILSHDLKKKEFENFYENFLNTITKKKSLIIVNESLNLEVLNLFKKICINYSNTKVCSIEYRPNTNYFNDSSKSFADLSLINKVCFLIAINPQTENALLNNKLRYFSFNRFVKIYNIGYSYQSNLKIQTINFDIKKLINFLKGKTPKVINEFVKQKNPLFFFGKSALERGINFPFFKNLIENTNPSAVLINIKLNSNSNGLKFMNINSLNTALLLKSHSLIFINSNETLFLRKILVNKKQASVFWFNPFMLSYSLKIETGFQIPTPTIFEESGTFLNIEYRPQKTQKILKNNVNQIILFNIMKRIFTKKNFAINNSDFFFKELFSQNIKFILSKKKTYTFFFSKIFNNLNHKYTNISQYPTKYQISDYYQTGYFVKYSKNMASASQELHKSFINFFI